MTKEGARSIGGVKSAKMPSQTGCEECRTCTLLTTFMEAVGPENITIEVICQRHSPEYRVNVIYMKQTQAKILANMILTNAAKKQLNEL